MKFGIIIQDLDASQAAELLEQLSGGQTVNVVGTASTGGNEAEFDSAGQPWDERIHAGTKGKNADGKWKKKKGVDEALVAQLESANKGATISDKIARAESVMGIAPPAATGNAPVAVGFAAPAVAPAAVTAPVPVAANVPSAPVAAPVAPPVPSAPTRDFKGLMQRISTLFSTKAIDPTYPNTIVQRINGGFGVQVATLTDVANDPRFVEYAWQCLEVDGKAA